MQFNSAVFKAEWRKLCEDREIDPAEGATSFQVAAYKAEVTENWRRHKFFARRYARPLTVQFWWEFEVLRGEVESGVVYDILRDARRTMIRLNGVQPIQSVQAEEELVSGEIDVAEIIQELTREMRRDVIHDIPLRQFQQMPLAAVVVRV